MRAPSSSPGRSAFSLKSFIMVVKKRVKTSGENVGTGFSNTQIRRALFENVVVTHVGALPGPNFRRGSEALIVVAWPS